MVCSVEAVVDYGRLSEVGCVAALPHASFDLF